MKYSKKESRLRIVTRLMIVDPFVQLSLELTAFVTMSSVHVVDIIILLIFGSVWMKEWMLSFLLPLITLSRDRTPHDYVCTFARSLVCGVVYVPIHYYARMRQKWSSWLHRCMTSWYWFLHALETWRLVRKE